MSRRDPTPWYRKSRNMWFVTIDGVQVALNVSGPNSKQEAQDALAALFAAAKGAAAKSAGSPAQPALTLESAVAQFLAQNATRIKPTTLHGYRWFLGQFLDHFGKNCLIGTLTAHQIEKSANRPKWSQSTKHDYLGTVGTFLRGAGYELRLRRPPKESRGADAVWTENEWYMIYGAARGDFKPLLTVLRETGCRPAEAAGLTVESVDWERRHCRLKQHKNSGKGKARVLVFPEALVAVLEDQRRARHRGHLFLNDDGRPFTGLSISRRLALARERAGVKRPVTAYGLRHSFCTRALATGASNAQVAALVGNSEAMIAKHYSHIDADAQLLKLLAERINRAG